MKKKVLALLTACLLLVPLGTTVHGALCTAKQLRIADALHHVELFLGTENGYVLEKELTRTQGIVLLIRLLGLEKEVLSGDYEMPFSDVDEWAEKYIGYAYENGITRGVSATKFGSSSAMTDYMFLTLVLRALGYRDSGENPEFVWDSPYQLATKAELISDEKVYSQFLRCDAIEIFWNALARNGYELAYDLADRGVFTRHEWEECIEIYRYGEIRSDDGEDDRIAEREEPEESSESGDETQSDSMGRVPETDAPETDEPETNKPGSGAPETDAPASSDEITYEDYIAMSGGEQQAYFLTYEDPADFFAWLNRAKAEYEAQNPSIEIGGDGSIDLGDLIG